MLFWLQLGDSNEDSRWLSGLSLAYGPSEEGSDELMGKPSWVRWLGFQQTHAIGGMTANLMVRGSPYNHTIQFNRSYPKTGGGEDIGLVVAVPGANALHPWWRGGNICNSQINGWAWGLNGLIKPFGPSPTGPKWLFLSLFLSLFFDVIGRHLSLPP